MKEQKPMTEEQQAERLAEAMASGTLVHQAATRDTLDLLITAININLRSKALLQQILQ